MQHHKRQIQKYLYPPLKRHPVCFLCDGWGVFGSEAADTNLTQHLKGGGNVSRQLLHHVHGRSVIPVRSKDGYDKYLIPVLEQSDFIV